MGTLPSSSREERAVAAAIAAVGMPEPTLRVRGSLPRPLACSFEDPRRSPPPSANPNLEAAKNPRITETDCCMTQNYRHSGKTVQKTYLALASQKTWPQIKSPLLDCRLHNRAYY